MPTVSELLHGSCGACERPLGRGRVSCLYCGWEPDRPDAAYGAVVREGSYHEGAILGRFVLATVLLGPIGVALARTGLEEDALALLGIAAFPLLLGPGVVLVQLLRRSRGAIEVTQEGIRRGGELLRWSDFTRAAVHGGFAGDSTWAIGYGRVMGMIRGPIGTMVKPVQLALAVLFFPFLFIAFVVIPGIGLLTPWGTRVVLDRSRGDRLVLRDLDDPTSFVNACLAKIEGPSSATRGRR